MRADHIEARGSAMYCTRCEGFRTITMPAKIGDIVEQMDSFRDAHISCSPHAIEAEMSEYIKGFDAGCTHLVREIELFMKTNPPQMHTLNNILQHFERKLK